MSETHISIYPIRSVGEGPSTACRRHATESADVSQERRRSRTPLRDEAYGSGCSTKAEVSHDSLLLA